MLIVPRQEIGVPPVPATRPKLAKQTKIELAHYTGIFVDGRGMDYNDPTKDWEYAREVAKFGIAAKKPFEYNYLIGLGGTIFEQAGEYRAAHCLNFNDDSLGVLFMVAVNVPLTKAAIDAWWALDDYLVQSGQLSADHRRDPHYMYRATGCCGYEMASVQGPSWQSPTGEGRLGTLILPLRIRQPLPPPPTPTPIPKENDMDLIDWKPGTDQFTGFTTNGPQMSWLNTGPARRFFVDAGHKPKIISDESLLALIKSTEKTTPAPPTLTPEMAAAWKF